AWRNRDAIVVHLVNLSNPMAMKGPYREFIAVGEQTITVRLPKDARVKKARLLVAEANPRIETGDEVRINVPSVLDHEVVTIDL
ncbi:MAG TPA: hypothetical protein VLK33_12385, partial [Terriglobales bacterium]|nr:hypothetical protein [Terriglobales bacterium]